MLLGVCLFEYVWTVGIKSKYHIKICNNSNQEEERSSLKIMNRRTPPQKTQLYGISVWAHKEILSNFIDGGVPLHIQSIHWDSLPHRKLQIATWYFDKIPRAGC